MGKILQEMREPKSTSAQAAREGKKLPWRIGV
jgi:hypothetical protein